MCFQCWSEPLMAEGTSSTVRDCSFPPCLVRWWKGRPATWPKPASSNHLCCWWSRRAHDSSASIICHRLTPRSPCSIAFLHAPVFIRTCIMHSDTATYLARRLFPRRIAVSSLQCRKYSSSGNNVWTLASWEVGWNCCATFSSEQYTIQLRGHGRHCTDPPDTSRSLWWQDMCGYYPRICMHGNTIIFKSIAQSLCLQCLCTVYSQIITMQHRSYFTVDWNWIRDLKKRMQLWLDCFPAPPTLHQCFMGQTVNLVGSHRFPCRSTIDRANRQFDLWPCLVREFFWIFNTAALSLLFGN